MILYCKQARCHHLIMFLGVLFEILSLVRVHLSPLQDHNLSINLIHSEHHETRILCDRNMTSSTKYPDMMRIIIK